MEAASIYYACEQAVSLVQIKALLLGMGLSVTDTEWSMAELPDVVVPQLYVSEPAQVLLQLNDHPDTLIEAREMADWYQDALGERAGRLMQMGCRIEVGAPGDNPALVTDDGITAFAGWTSLDPAERETQSLLRGLAGSLNGYLWDNVNGTWWFGDES